MKVQEVREVLRQLAAMNERHGLQDMATALRDLADVMQEFDKQTVAAFLKRAAQGGR